VLRNDRLDGFDDFHGKLLKRFSVGSDPGWEDIDNRYADVNFALELLKAIVRSDAARFSSIVIMRGHGVFRPAIQARTAAIPVASTCFDAIGGIAVSIPRIVIRCSRPLASG
jgi:hypothetical protein